MLEKEDKKIIRKKLIANISECKYPIIKNLLKTYNFKITDNEIFSEYEDLIWTDNAIESNFLGRMKPYQKVNHIPGIYSISRKNYLAKHLNKMQKKFPNYYNFFPKTWIVPAERGELIKIYGDKKKTFILKPEGSCQGRGIFLVQRVKDIPITENLVCQSYLKHPLLIDKCKFDLRIYLLISSVSPLRVMLYKEGMVRIATDEYKLPNENNLQLFSSHLTNYSMNKNNPKYLKNNNADNAIDGHKRSMTFFKNMVENEGKNWDVIWDSIKELSLYTLLSVYPLLLHNYKVGMKNDFGNSCCFHILGLDIIFNTNYKPILLEVNHTPSFNGDSPFDIKLKSGVISNALKIINMNTARKQKTINFIKKQIQKRMISGIKSDKDDIELKEFIDDNLKRNDNYMKKYLGDYDEVFPWKYDKILENNDNLKEILNYSKIIYDEFTGNTKKEVIENKPKPIIPSTKKDTINNNIKKETTSNNIIKKEPIINIKNKVFQKNKTIKQNNKIANTSNNGNITKRYIIRSVNKKNIININNNKYYKFSKTSIINFEVNSFFK